MKASFKVLKAAIVQVKKKKQKGSSSFSAETTEA
jgi:hypothetical protein